VSLQGGIACICRVPLKGEKLGERSKPSQAIKEIEGGEKKKNKRMQENRKKGGEYLTCQGGWAKGTRTPLTKKKSSFTVGGGGEEDKGKKLGVKRKNERKGRKGKGRGQRFSKERTGKVRET